LVSSGHTKKNGQHASITSPAVAACQNKHPGPSKCLSLTKTYQAVCRIGQPISLLSYCEKGDNHSVRIYKRTQKTHEREIGVTNPSVQLDSVTKRSVTAVNDQPDKSN